MDVSVHKTGAVFDRYNIVDERDLKDAAQRLSRYLSGELGHSSGIDDVQKGKPELAEKANSFFTTQKNWLGGLDSNQFAIEAKGRLHHAKTAFAQIEGVA